MATGIEVLSAGLIVFRRQDQNIEYLLLKHASSGRHWGPPKGHVDPGEAEFAAALRETQEEAGLKKEQLKIFDFQTAVHYRHRLTQKKKKVIYWVSELTDSDAKVTLSPEHLDYRWTSLEEAMPLFEQFQTEYMKEALKDAHEFITKSLSN